MRCANCGDDTISHADAHIRGGQDEYYICKADPVYQLGVILKEVNARVTFDHHRNNTHPCYLCGEPPARGGAYDLIQIGTYSRNLFGGLQAGDPIVRPVCLGCRIKLDGQ